MRPAPPEQAVLVFGARAWLRTIIVLAALAVVVPSLAGCSTARQPAPAVERVDSIERPARGLGDEDRVVDKAGKALVAVLVVGIAITVIALPLLLLL